MRYEIKDISPPEQIRRSMELQAESERIKRSKILSSEGERQALINIAEGDKSAAILEGEGQANKILQEARAIVQALNNISASIEKDDKMVALKLKLTERYLEAMSDILEKSKILVLPSDSSMKNQTLGQIATGLELYNEITGGGGKGQTAQNLMNNNQAYIDINEKLEKLKTERRKIAKGGSTGGDESKYQFMDDKILYSTE